MPNLPKAAPTAASTGILAGLGRMLGLGSGSSSTEGAPQLTKPPFLYFGLPSNAAQEQVISSLSNQGCCVLVGPPGTGKTQTIANVVCHYLATGRRVLVTSKGEPATEVLRQKLPDGVRELAVSLGSADAASYRRLEAAVENLANNVANADRYRLGRETERLRRRVGAITDELAALEASEEKWAQPYFPVVDSPPDGSASSSSASGSASGGYLPLFPLPGDGGKEPKGGGGGAAAGPLAAVPLHADHLGVLEVNTVDSATLTQLADVVVSVLHPDAYSSASSSSFSAVSAGPRKAADSRSFFLADVTIDPLRPPPALDLLESIRQLRHHCADALRWGSALQKRATKTEDLPMTDLHPLASLLLTRARLEAKVESNELPRINPQAVEDARRLSAILTTLSTQLADLERCSPSLAATGGKGSKLDSSKVDTSWLFSMMKHADSAPATRALECTLRTAKRLAALGRDVVSAGQVYTPALLRTMIDDAVAAAEADGSLLTNDHAASLHCEALAEVTWRARPEQRGFLSEMSRRLGGAPGGQSLSAVLDLLKVDGHAPATAREWQLIEQALLLRVAAATFRCAWKGLDPFENKRQPLPTEESVGKASGAGSSSSSSAMQLARHASSSTMIEHGPTVAFALWVDTNLCSPLEAGHACFATAQGLAACAAASLESSWAGIQGVAALKKARGGRASCDELKASVAMSLRIHEPEMQSAVQQKQAMVEELERCDPASKMAPSPAGGEVGVSPVGKLRQQVERLGAIELSEDEAINGVQAAREKLVEARESLKRLSELKKLAGRLNAPQWEAHILKQDGAHAGGGDGGKPRDPCPPDAQRLWSALAATEALRRMEKRDPAAARGVAGATRRLIEEREEAVCALVAAAAKQALREAMSPETCAALQRLVSAVSLVGSTSDDSVRAQRYKADLADALEGCVGNVPCWIMPTWRISQCLPATIAAFDLVVLDEASQSDITALPALLRGKQVLVVGDGRQVSPTSAFIKEEQIKELKMTLVRKHPYPDQLLPGMSIFDLAQTCFGDARVSLSEHFRCVPSCISFSNEKFYHGRLLPRRLPPRSQRLDPPLLEVVVPGGKKEKNKINLPEAEALVQWLRENLRDDPALRDATVGIISLGGSEQARKLRGLVLSEFTDVEIARHRIVAGDPSLWQGDERDLILLSLTSGPGERSTVATVGPDASRKYNVALSRARDRMVLFRSVAPKDVTNPDDLRLWTMQFFARGADKAGPSPPAPKAAAGRSATLSNQLHDWLALRGYRFTTECALGGAVAIVEDSIDDQRLCVCLDGGVGATLPEWIDERRAQLALERAGWKFHRIWRASWLVDRARCEAELATALSEAMVSPLLKDSAAAAAEAASAKPTVVSAAAAGKRKAGSSDDGAAPKPDAGRKKAKVAPVIDSDDDDDMDEEPVVSSKKQGKQPASPKPPPPPKAPKAEKPKVPPKEKKEPPAKKEPPKKKEAAAKKEPPAAKKPKRKREDDEWEPGDD